MTGKNSRTFNFFSTEIVCLQICRSRQGILASSWDQQQAEENTFTDPNDANYGCILPYTVSSI